MTDVHTEHRDLLAAGDDVDCDDCADFASRLATVRRTARLLDVAAPPPGLADRVAAAVASLHPPAPTPAPIPANRRLVIRTTAIAAAALLVIGIAVTLPRDEDDPGRKLLLAAATSTEDAGSARVRVQGSADIEVPRLDDHAPNFEGVPVEMRGWMEQRWAEIEAQFELQVAEFERRAQDTLDQGMAQAQEAFERAMREFARNGSQGPPPTPPRPPAPPAPPPHAPAAPRPQLPDRLSVGVAVAADGVVGFGGRLNVSGSVRPVDGSVDAPSSAAAFEVRASAGALALRRPDGSWASLETTAATPWAALLARPDGVVRLLRSAEGDVEVVGRSGGLRHVRFAVGDDFAEAWIDDDDRVRRLNVVSQRTPEGAKWRSSVSVELSDFGVEVPAVVSPELTGEAGGSSSLVYPLGSAVAAALEAR